nr:hypothetical protein [Solirubrobacterales bacterium]
MPALSQTTDPEGVLGDALAALWVRRRDGFAVRVATIEAAVVASLGAELGDTERVHAASEAHKLVGALG